MPQQPRGFDDAETTQRVAPGADAPTGLDHVVHVSLGVHAARDGEPDQFQQRVFGLTGIRIGMGEGDRTEFNPPHAALQVQLNGQRLARELVAWNVGQQGSGVDVNGMAPGRLDDRDVRIHQPGPIESSKRKCSTA